MDVPSMNHHIWADIVTGKTGVAFEFLAVRVMLGRMLPAVRSDPSTAPKHAAELHEMFARNAHLPSLQRDLAKVLR